MEAATANSKTKLGQSAGSRWSTDRETLSPSPLSAANANYPPQDRQRVRRACESCRKKKIKCNGQEPCQKCRGSRGVCLYVDGESRIMVESARKTEQLEERLESMERMLRVFMDRMDTVGLGGGSLTAPEPVLAVAPDPQLGNEGAAATQATEDEAPVVELESGLNNGDVEVSNDKEYDPTEEPDTDGENHPPLTRYADGFGELDTDGNGDLRYVGHASTASVVDTCIGLRQHISDELARKGYTRSKEFLSSPEAVMNQPPDPYLTFLRQTMRRDLPPSRTIDVLIEAYTSNLFFLYPILQEADIRNIAERVLSAPEGEMDSAYTAVLFALCAVAEPLLPANIQAQVSQAATGRTPFCTLASYFINDACTRPPPRSGSGFDIVVALGLLSAALASTGSEAEAWLTVGRAIRQGQDLGLHRSPVRLRLPGAERTKRRYVWWCLYVLERQLCTALGRPLAIDDADCDVEMPSASADGSALADATAGFLALIPLYRIMGRILHIVSALKSDDKWPPGELQARVREANAALQTWAQQVPGHIKTATAAPSGPGSPAVEEEKTRRALAEKHIALSCFFSAVLVLHRVFMWNPHRPSPLGNPTTAIARSVKAATDCIRGAAGFSRAVPPGCHYVVFHGQYVFISAIVLLHSVRAAAGAQAAAAAGVRAGLRQAANMHGLGSGSGRHGYGADVDAALENVAIALEWLKELSPGAWAGASKCVGTVEGYLEFTLMVLRDGWRGGRGGCYFNDDAEGGERWTRTYRCEKSVISVSDQPSAHHSCASSRKKKRRKEEVDVRDSCKTIGHRKRAQQPHGRSHQPPPVSSAPSMASSTSSMASSSPASFVRSPEKYAGAAFGLPAPPRHHTVGHCCPPNVGLLPGIEPLGTNLAPALGPGPGRSQVAMQEYHEPSSFDDVVENLLGMSTAQQVGMDLGVADPIFFSGFDDLNFDMDGFSSMF